MAWRICQPWFVLQMQWRLGAERGRSWCRKVGLRIFQHFGSLFWKYLLGIFQTTTRLKVWMALETPIPATSGACLNSFCCLAENLKPVVCEGLRGWRDFHVSRHVSWCCFLRANLKVSWNWGTPSYHQLLGDFPWNKLYPAIGVAPWLRKPLISIAHSGSFRYLKLMYCTI